MTASRPSLRSRREAAFFMSGNDPLPGWLALSDGTLFEGELIGAPLGDVPVDGEVVFNTVMSGYQEVISDPSYAGQIITFTTSHLGNYGVNPIDDESARPRCRAVVVRDLSRRTSSWRAEETLHAYLVRHGVPGLAGVDTRRLTRAIRERGAVPAAIAADPDAARRQAGDATGTDGLDLVASVTTDAVYEVASATAATRRIVAVDCGMKTTIVRCLAQLGTVRVVPANTPAADILAVEPDGVFLSNGPGDPAQVAHVAHTVADMLGRTTVFGICMGHQMLATAVGGRTYKLPFGHHGGNHPVRNLATGAIEITSQNHNFAVDVGAVHSAEPTHVNLNDGTLEGFRIETADAFAVQHHPEAGPGPHDARYLFDEFAARIDARRNRKVVL